jgi:hypothetical protein
MGHRCQVRPESASVQSARLSSRYHGNIVWLGAPRDSHELTGISTLSSQADRPMILPIPIVPIPREQEGAGLEGTDGAGLWSEMMPAYRLELGCDTIQMIAVELKR